MFSFIDILPLIHAILTVFSVAYLVFFGGAILCVCLCLIEKYGFRQGLKEIVKVFRRLLNVPREEEALIEEAPVEEALRVAVQEEIRIRPGRPYFRFYMNDRDYEADDEYESDSSLSSCSTPSLTDFETESSSSDDSGIYPGQLYWIDPETTLEEVLSGIADERYWRWGYIESSYKPYYCSLKNKLFRRSEDYIDKSKLDDYCRWMLKREVYYMKWQLHERMHWGKVPTSAFPGFGSDNESVVSAPDPTVSGSAEFDMAVEADPDLYWTINPHTYEYELMMKR
ncbi:hypothetical protein K501DRAFT_280435 [Backusella circina FSU 941]|nr:hypothetical protein K501DRAFT_280435 [Backusella circina FSU 941]